MINKEYYQITDKFIKVVAFINVIIWLQMKICITSTLDILIR
jgi:hypothetical protein